MGNGDQGDIAPDEFATWITPAVALNMLSHMDGRTARVTIHRRLANGIIKSAAETATFNRRSAPFVRITQDTWEKATNGIAVSSFWITGDITIEVPTVTSLYPPLLALFGVRFDPAGIRALIPKTSEVAPQSNPDEDNGGSSRPMLEQPGRGPPIPAVLLAAWYEVYRKAYTRAADTEAMAMKSASGMFPDKLVSRDRVRALRGAQKRGRKATNSEV